MTKDQLIAEAFVRWPDARVFVRGDNGVVYARTTQDLWHSRGPADTRWYLTVNPLPRVPDDFTEIPRPTPPVDTLSREYLLANLPAEGVRVFEDSFGRLYTVLDIERNWSAEPGVASWDVSSDPWSADQYIDSPYYTEIQRPKSLFDSIEEVVGSLAASAAKATYAPGGKIPRPTPLPDPSGDLPDGTKVRVTYLGVVSRWKEERGIVRYSKDGEFAGFRGHLVDINATIEVLEVPTPPVPSPLDAEPGSRWRDPETGTEWVKGLKLFAQVVGGVVNGAALVPGYSDDLPILARLVPVPTHETVSTVEALDALPSGSSIRDGSFVIRKAGGAWYYPGNAQPYSSDQVVVNVPVFTVVWRGEG